VKPLPTRLRLHMRQTILAIGEADPVTLAVAPQGLAVDFFRHQPPTPHELEQAIDAIEDALMSTRIAHDERGTLVTGEPLVRAIPGLQQEGDSLTRDAVEVLFQRLASSSLAPRLLAAAMSVDAETTATMLLLRELMHHLGFAEVTVASDR
jgi:hypothetical protein